MKPVAVDLCLEQMALLIKGRTVIWPRPYLIIIYANRAGTLQLESAMGLN